MPLRSLTALPVYNEVGHVRDVLAEVRRYSSDILAVDDGSTDGTREVLENIPGINVLRHEKNQGYGAALLSAFRYARENGYDVLVTIDCDGQHEPQRIGQLAAACREVDIVSGSRYLDLDVEAMEVAPQDRRQINFTITRELNEQLGLNLTDAFCGFKAYRVEALRHLHLTETGYAMPLELWVQAAHAGLKIIELGVPLIYLDEKRSFGGSLDDAQVRLRHYRDVIRRARQRTSQPSQTVWSSETGSLSSCPVDCEPC